MINFFPRAATVPVYCAPEPLRTREIAVDMHEAFKQFLTVGRTGKPTIADGSNRKSVAIARSIVHQALGGESPVVERRSSQARGSAFEVAVLEFLREECARSPGPLAASLEFANGRPVEKFEQYAHLASLDTLVRKDETGALGAVIGADYRIKPDVVCFRQSGSDLPLLHACISCKLTIRSDRVQNVRHEGTVLVRHRQGRTPHVIAVTAEPFPSRIQSIAMGSGEIDCVYHVALVELLQATEGLRDKQLGRTIRQLQTQRRLRDIAELPIELCTR